MEHTKTEINQNNKEPLVNDNLSALFDAISTRQINVSPTNAKAIHAKTQQEISSSSITHTPSLSFSLVKHPKGIATDDPQKEASYTNKTGKSDSFLHKGNLNPKSPNVSTQDENRSPPGSGTESSTSGNEDQDIDGDVDKEKDSMSQNQRKRKTKSKKKKDGLSNSSSDVNNKIVSVDSGSSGGSIDSTQEVMLDRDVLLQMSSTAFEEYASSLSTGRTLSNVEEKQIKAQRRLISNRESAQASRKRKKAYVEELELKLNDLNTKVTQLQANNAILSAQLQESNNENQILQNLLDSKVT